MSADAAILADAGRCPFCAYNHLWLWDKGVAGKFAVSCSNPACAATGPIADSPTAAVMAWNRAPRSVTAKPNAALSRTLDEMHESRR